MPLVCIPMGRDQRANTTRVVRPGAGARVSKAASSLTIATAIEHVLGTPAGAANAGRAAQMLTTEAATLPTPRTIEAMLGITPARHHP